MTEVEKYAESKTMRVKEFINILEKNNIKKIILKYRKYYDGEFVDLYCNDVLECFNNWLIFETGRKDKKLDISELIKTLKNVNNNYYKPISEHMEVRFKIYDWCIWDESREFVFITNRTYEIKNNVLYIQCYFLTA